MTGLIASPARQAGSARARAPAPATSRPRVAAIVILLLWGIIIVPAGTFSLQPLDRDESRFMQATAQMLETGDFIEIRYQDDERNKKPVGIHWLQAASVSLFSEVENRAVWPYRLPSMLAGLACLLAVYLAGVRLVGERAAFWGAFLLATAPTFAGEATIAKTDMALTAAIAIAQGALARIWLDWQARVKTGWTTPLILWIALAAGILIKGPVAPMVSALTGGALFAYAGLAQRRNPLPLIAACRPVSGAALAILLTAPWFIAIGLATEGRFFAEAVGVDMVGKIGETQESHGGPAGYYLLGLPLFFWPLALFLPAALWRAATGARNTGLVFLLAWLIPAWLLFELASTKLTHYVLPLYPALALLAASGTCEMAKAGRRTATVLRWGGAVLHTAGTLVIMTSLFWLIAHFDDDPVGWWRLGALWLFGLIASPALVCFLAGQIRTAMLASGLAGAVLAWGLFEATLPHLDALRLTPRLSEALHAEGRHPRLDGAPPVALIGYNEPSAVFLLGTGTPHLLPVEAAGWLAADRSRVVVTDSDHDAAFLAAIDTLAPEIDLRVVARLDGFNYSNSHPTTLTLYTAD